nr:uncharacterized protein LOC109150821 [Ipomoea batatas]GME14928.1 uncharacterized protein LOC109150821 [Ipomoea batatas]
MQVLGVEEPLMCKAFLPTLKGLAQKWFLALPSRSIRCFNDLVDRFLTHYVVNIKSQRNLTHLSGISQDEGEALKTYLARWQKEVQTIEGLDEQVSITFFMESLRAGKLFIDLHNGRPKTYVEAIQRASRQADTEEANQYKCLPVVLDCRLELRRLGVPEWEMETARATWTGLPIGASRRLSSGEGDAVTCNEVSDGENWSPGVRDGDDDFPGQPTGASPSGSGGVGDGDGGVGRRRLFRRWSRGWRLSE